MPTKLVVTDSDKGRVVSLESSRGNTLLMSAPLADKRAIAGAIRSLKAVLKDSVTVDDRTVTPPAKPSRPARVAPAAKVAKRAKAAKTTTPPVAALPARRTRAAKGLAATPAAVSPATLEATPKPRKRAARVAK